MRDYDANSTSTGFDSPFRFNGKELDKETGLAYYSARYYQNRYSLWLSVDPLAGERSWLTPYNFVQNNPVLRIDPDGNLDICETCPQNAAYDVFRNSEVQYDYNSGSENEAGIGTVSPRMSSLGGAEVIAPKANVNSQDMNGVKAAITSIGIGKDMMKGAALSTQADIVNDAKVYVDKYKQIPSADKLAYKNLGKLGAGMNLLGKATGVASSFIAWKDYSESPTTGNLIQAITTTALIPLKINPVIGLIIGISDITGFSDKIFDGIGNNIDNSIKQ